MRVYLSIFFFPIIQIFCISQNVKAIADNNILGILLFAFLINVVWCQNVSQMKDAHWKKQVLYGLGGACGGYLSYLVAKYIPA